MNLLTMAGRLQTKLLTFIILAGITIVFTIFGNAAYWQLFIAAVGVGLVLETFWGRVLEYQPGYMTWLTGIIEFLAISVVAALWHLPITLAEAAVYYSLSWVIIQLILIYLLPVIRLSWGDHGGEIFYRVSK